MDFPADALPLLRCPASGAALHLREAKAADGALPPGCESLLCTDDDKFCYPIVDGIAHLLATDALSSRGGLGPEKEMVRSFYEDYGWQKSSETYKDTSIFGDRREFYQSYEQAGLTRTLRSLGSGGQVFLDAASGPVQHDASLRETSGYRWYVCVDLSLEALKQARRRLGARALCLRADITALPLAPGTVDACLSLHTIYHVPRDEQAAAVRSLYAALAPGGRLAVVYTRPSPAVWRTLALPARAMRRFQRLVQPQVGEPRPPLYAHFHPPEDLCAWIPEQRGELGTHLLVGPDFARDVLRPGRGGRTFLRACEALEDRAHPGLAKICQYPLLRWDKPAR